MICRLFMLKYIYFIKRFIKYIKGTGTCFIQKICRFLLPCFASIFFAYLWSFRWPNYIVTLPRYFSFRLPHLNIPTGPPHTNWTRIFSERRLVYFSVIETDTATSGLRWIFHMHSEFSRPAMCNNAIMTQALVSFKKYVPPPLPYLKVDICPFPLPLFASIFFRLFVSLSLTQLYRYTPEIFLFSTATFKYIYRTPLKQIGQEYWANVAY